MRQIEQSNNCSRWAAGEPWERGRRSEEQQKNGKRLVETADASCPAHSRIVIGLPCLQSTCFVHCHQLSHGFVRVILPYEA